MQKPIKIQLAIQGGGAKIVAIMAVLDALEELNHKIQVTKIVGTSAGAIAGAFFASGLGIKTVVAGWKNGELNALLASLSIPKSKFLPRAIALGHHLMKREPLWSSDDIHKYLASEFNKCSPRCNSFDDLEKIKGIKVKVISTNLRNRSSEESKGTDPIVSTLIDSAGLPYLLRKWQSGGAAVVVDGGIGDNLPATRLDINNPEETPVCISFQPEVGAASNPGNFVDFSLALLDAAIDVASKKSAALVPHTHFIDTTIGTFDFKQAIAAISSGEYQRLKTAAKNWFDELYQSIQDREEQKVIAYSVTRLHPWQTENATALAVMSGLWRAINEQFKDQHFNFHYVEMRATLGCLAQTKGDDTIKYTVEFEPGDEPLYCYWLGVADGVAGQLTKEPVLKIQAVDSDEYVPHVQVPAISPEETNARYVAVFFTPPLTKGKRYKLVQTEVGNNLVTKLVKDKKDEIGFAPNRVKGSISKARLIVDVPETVKSYTIKAQRDIKGDGIKEHYPDKVQGLPEIKSIEGYSTHVVESANVEGLFAIDITVVT